MQTFILIWGKYQHWYIPLSFKDISLFVKTLYMKEKREKPQTCLRHNNVFSPLFDFLSDLWIHAYPSTNVWVFRGKGVPQHQWISGCAFFQLILYFIKSGYIMLSVITGVEWLHVLFLWADIHHLSIMTHEAPAYKKHIPENKTMT